MIRLSPRHLLVALAMLAAAGLAVALTPSRYLAQDRPEMDLETAIPRQFGGWELEATVDIIMPDPQVQAAVDRIYSQTLTRTYVNASGEQIMLSIAYGGDQSDSLQAHLPEGCYRGQGFAIQDKFKTLLDTALGTLPVARLVASKDYRTEPITYWIVVGDQATDDSWEMKKAKLRYALKGEVPDGMLVRISSITPDIDRGYAMQKDFAVALLSALTPAQRLRLMGAPKG